MAETLNLFIDEPNELSFDLTIEGTEMAKPIVRTIIEGSKFELMFPTDRKAEGWTVTIPPLQEVLSTGKRNLRPLQTEFSKSQIVEARVINNSKPNTVVKASVVRANPKDSAIVISEEVSPSKGERKSPVPTKKTPARSKKKTVHKSIPTLEKILQSL
jgi:hypothetical protein